MWRKGLYLGVMFWVFMHVNLCGEGIYRSFEHFKNSYVDYPTKIKQIYSKHNGLIEVKNDRNERIIFERDSVYGFERAGKKYVRIGNYFAEASLKHRLNPIIMIRTKEKTTLDEKITKYLDTEIFETKGLPSQFYEMFLLDNYTGEIIRIDRAALEQKYKEIPSIWKAYKESSIPRKKRFRAFIPKYNAYFKHH